MERNGTRVGGASGSIARMYAAFVHDIKEGDFSGAEQVGGRRSTGVVASSWRRQDRVGRAERDTGLCGVRAQREAYTSLQLRAMAVEFPEVQGHPNRLPFEGVLTLVDVASDKAPSGSRGHRVVLTREAAQAALPSLLGMAVGYKAGWDGHDARQKCGIITAAELDGRRLMVSGFLFARDFPEFGRTEKDMGRSGMEDGAMGMSYELADAHVADMRASVWTLTQATFTGAAILLREKAAYRDTSFRVKRPTCAGERGSGLRQR